jgi:hypothetical protein
LDRFAADSNRPAFRVLGLCKPALILKTATVAAVRFRRQLREQPNAKRFGQYGTSPYFEQHISTREAFMEEGSRRSVSQAVKFASELLVLRKAHKDKWSVDIQGLRGLQMFVARSIPERMRYF